MRFFKALVLIASFSSYGTLASSYYAIFGEFNSGLYNSADEACIGLSTIIYPTHYNEPLIGSRSIVNEISSSQCATQFSYKSAGTAYWETLECSNPNETGQCSDPIAICPDGLPENLNGYPACDRPPLTQCVDGPIIEADTQICPSVCTDFDTCQQYAISMANCAGATYFEFNYTNASQWNYDCHVIDDSSPDHSNNGGNQDGNTNNDPLSPDTDGIGQLDSQSFITELDTALQNDFGNLERAIRDGNDENSNLLTEFKNENSDNLNNIHSTSEQLLEKLESTNGHLSQISNNVSDCIPNPENRYCENPHGLDQDFITTLTSSVETHLDEEKSTAIDAVKSEITSISEESPIDPSITDGVFDYFTDIFPEPQSCIPLTFGSTNQVFSFTITCEFSDKFKDIFGFLISIYTILQLIEILMTGIKPRLNGGQ